MSPDEITALLAPWRELYETDPTVSQSSIAASVGLRVHTVNAYARRLGWRACSKRRGTPGSSSAPVATAPAGSAAPSIWALAQGVGVSTARHGGRHSDRPIIFSAPMVRAILAGQKTQTRRLVKPQPTHFNPAGVPRGADAERASDVIRCPHGRPGDRLWVREAWAAPHAHDHLVPRWIPRDARIHYAATEDRGGLIWRSPIFIPRWASRITLEITGIRVERLQDISAVDCWAEGIGHSPDVDPRHEYAELWESLHGAGSWDANPWVWALSFRRAEGGAA